MTEVARLPFDHTDPLGAAILYGPDNPLTVAGGVAAAIGSKYVRNTTGAHYLKQGASSVAWAEVLAGGNVVNPMHPDYGAKGNDKSVLDGAITTATTALTSATAAFTSADVGKTIVVAGAATPTSGSGTATSTAGVTTFSASQAGVIYDGSIVIVSGTAYTVSLFNGTTSATLSGTPTFGATAFTIVQNLSTTIAAYVSATAVTLTASAGRTVSAAYVGYGTDDTAAIVAAIAAAAAGGRALRIPAGRYVITSRVDWPTQVSFLGENIPRVVFVHRPTADGICFRLISGSAIAYNNVIGNFSIYSDDLTWTKVAIEVDDVSSLALGSISISGSRTGLASYYSGGTGSIGLRTKGREATGLKNLKIVADKPIVVDANPNTARTDGEDIDHWHGEDFYLVANANYNIEVLAGIGISHLTLEGYQAWVGGLGGFKMNDTRAAPTIVSRAITICNARGEQCTDPNGWLINITATQPIQTLELRNLLAAATMQGMSVNGVLQMLTKNCIMATASGKTALSVTGATGGSVIRNEGFYASPAALVTLTGYQATITGAWNSTLSAAPADATYVNVLAGSAVSVAALTVTGTASTTVARFGSGTGDFLQLLSNAAGSGVNLRSTNNAQSDFNAMILTFATLDLFYRTGTATAATMATVDTNGVLSLLKRLFVGTPAGAKQTASALSAGTGAPNNADGVNGDIYFNGAGAALTTIYQKRAGAWVGIV